MSDEEKVELVRGGMALGIIAVLTGGTESGLSHEQLINAVQFALRGYTVSGAGSTYPSIIDVALRSRGRLDAMLAAVEAAAEREDG